VASRARRGVGGRSWRMGSATARWDATRARRVSRERGRRGPLARGGLAWPCLSRPAGRAQTALPPDGGQGPRVLERAAGFSLRSVRPPCETRAPTTPAGGRAGWRLPRMQAKPLQIARAGAGHTAGSAPAPRIPFPLVTVCRRRRVADAPGPVQPDSWFREIRRPTGRV